jgi:hypothetical protein
MVSIAMEAAVAYGEANPCNNLAEILPDHSSSEAHDIFQG